MSGTGSTIPFVDLFAGPGGLGEGFASFQHRRQRLFKSVLSIEKEASAHQTLRLRSFFRLFPRGEAPEDYYRMLRGELTLEALYAAYPKEATQADDEARCLELGAASLAEVRRRISHALDDADPWILLGGPPCQPFSLAGRSRNRRGTRYSDGNETRHELYVEYLQIIADFWPAVFVMENVRGLLSAQFDGQGMFHRIADDLHDPATALRRIGGRGRRQTLKQHTYRLYPVAPASGHIGDGIVRHDSEIADFLVRAEDYGIPQARHRVILLGVREDIEDKPRPLRTKKQIATGRVLFGLPRVRSGLSRAHDADEWRSWIQGALQTPWFKELDAATAEAVRRAVAQLSICKAGRGGAFVAYKPSIRFAKSWYLDTSIEGVCNHEARGHMASDLHRYLFASSFAVAHKRSPCLRDFPTGLLPAHESVNNALVGGHFADRFRVQVSKRPSTTIVSHIAKDGHYYIHPDPRQCRSLTVREAARLQTFPDNYLFLGNRTQQYTQVGNAVPPLLALKIAEVVCDLLRRAGKL